VRFAHGDAVDDADRLWLGATRPPPFVPRGRAGRVFDRLFLRATIPDYTLPLITDALISELMAEFDNGCDDELPAAPRADVITFLSARRGQYLAEHDRP
jgi:hypothetical protein